MKIIAAAALALSTLTATTAVAGGGDWTHAPRINSQYEGGYNVGEALSINYGCDGYTVVSFNAPQGADGDVSVQIDGKEIWKGPNGKTDSGRLWVSLGHQGGLANVLIPQDQYNTLINALAKGTEAKVVNAAGEDVAVYPLKGSSKITNCLAS